MSLFSARSAGMTVLRRARAALGGTAVVLNYHRVADKPLDPELLCIAPERFAEHVAAVARSHTIISVRELLACLAEGRCVPRSAVVITLDDGYADALHVAKPILERYEAPATVFVASGYVGSDCEFWWDALERLVLSPGVLPTRIAVSVDGTQHAFALDDRSAVLDEATAASFAGWDFMLEVTHPRQRLYLDLVGLLKPLSAARRDSVLEQLKGQARVSHGAREENRPLTSQEVHAIVAGGLIDIGAHTVSHQLLAGLGIDEQRKEVQESKVQLEMMLGGRPVDSFAYPYGGSEDYTSETVEVVRSAGFTGAFTTRLGGRLPWGSASTRTPRYEIPRTATTNLSARELAALVDKRLGI